MILILEELTELQSLYNSILQELNTFASAQNKHNSLVQTMQQAQRLSSEIYSITLETNYADFGSNIQMLNGYYRHLLSEAMEGNDVQSIYELKYHLLELHQSLNTYLQVS